MSFPKSTLPVSKDTARTTRFKLQLDTKSDLVKLFSSHSQHPNVLPIKGDPRALPEIKLNTAIHRPMFHHHPTPSLNQPNNWSNHEISTENCSRRSGDTSLPSRTMKKKNSINQPRKHVIETAPDSLIKLPNNYRTDDEDLKCLIDLFNEPIDQGGYISVINEKGIKVFKKQVENSDNILIKSSCHIPFPKETVFNCITDVSTRMKWDSVFSELKIVDVTEGGFEILYLSLKSPTMLVSNRDFVQQRKIWKGFPDESSVWLHFKSVKNSKCPTKKGYVRADTIISGYYIEDDKEGGSKWSVISQSDIKGSVPVFLVNKFAPSSSKSWINSLIKGCQMLENTKKKNNNL